MKHLYKLFFFFLLPISAWTQETIATIKATDFNKEFDNYTLASADGWLYHQGNDVNWAKETIDVSDWQKLKPSELSIKNADENGRVEGWFRTKIIFDNSLDNKLIGVKLGSWAATDLYINGQLVTSSGNTGIDVHDFKEQNPYGKLSFPANLKSGQVYTIALHVVDFKHKLMPSLLRSQYSDAFGSILSLKGEKFDSLYTEMVNESIVFYTMIPSVFAILTLLFWILLLQNPTEKNLRLIAYCTTMIMLIFFSASREYFVSTFSAVEFWNIVNGIAVSLFYVLTLLIIISVFNRKVSKSLKVFLVAFSIFMFSNNFLPADISEFTVVVLTVLLFIICIYYTVSSWKNLKGAQWAVVIGLLVFILLVITYFTLRATKSAVFTPIVSRVMHTCLALSFPLSLLVYVSMRFKEIINEVQFNAKRVINLSEEKREQAINQQKVLQEEVQKQTAEIRTTLENLKSTQSQLIQAEKMASLGELTAGIAHEIQNPLNFVNNFSEVSNELLDEIKEERAKKKEERDEELVGEILDDIKQNLEKINHHGKRADAIVKGMLEHSRSSSGTKEPTDVNKLADEYLRLSYHGLRAKDKSFNATLVTNFDETIGKIDIIPQDIGRVILNLITNAFYACTERSRSATNEKHASTSSAGQEYEPTVTVSTKKLEKTIEVSIKDNANGIPPKVLDKIFQPFFTTKPTGQGTGLGLSLAYDIVKAHGGELKVSTEENVGTEFIISIPIKE